MVGRGHRRGRGCQRTARAGPANPPDAEESRVPRYLADLLAPLTAQMGVITELMARMERQPPPPPPQEVPLNISPMIATETPTSSTVPPLTPQTGEDQWFRMIEGYQKLQAPDYYGGTDPRIAEKWKEDVGSILRLLGADPVQKQRLAAFSLKGEARKWYQAEFPEEDNLDITWGEFSRKFDLQFNPLAVDPERRMETAIEATPPVDDKGRRKRPFEASVPEGPASDRPAKFTGLCYKCRIRGHKAAECRRGRRKESHGARDGQGPGQRHGRPQEQWQLSGQQFRVSHQLQRGQQQQYPQPYPPQQQYPQQPQPQRYQPKLEGQLHPLLEAPPAFGLSLSQAIRLYQPTPTQSRGRVMTSGAYDAGGPVVKVLFPYDFLFC